MSSQMRRAFELYDLRWRGDGHDLDDWLQAESDLLRQQNKAAAP
jgi:outer membrane protein TolC